MNNIEILKRAESFLDRKKIEYVRPGMIGIQENHRVEVIFLVPDALNPNVVVDPPDVRLWVNIYSGDVELIPQM